MITMQHSPGQTATIFLETFDGYGAHTDCVTIPYVSRIFDSTLALLDGYPSAMTQFGVGLYFSQYTIPPGATSVGSYLIEVSFIDPIDGYTKTQMTQIVVTAPFGQYSVISI